MRTAFLFIRFLLILAWIAWLVAFWQGWLAGGWAIIAISAVGIAESAYTQVSQRSPREVTDARSG
ncbi:hypothetical protein Pan44_52110 [Caulifigura coniformis]|uniref:Uncharacterized protein n=1 Tax=Caulifigura coniformis TaxID=2527983 RepID=A0A517SLZ4_9PLAN|nr:hypothetical protein [Caulifigura coniformis]QDT57144.1 hypothetical protein Pan44_52110 [Caulifigura coniformis]